MILGHEWMQDFFFDKLNYILVNIIDLILYSIMGLLFQIYMLIGSFDLFGGITPGTESAMTVYNELSKRIYSVLGIIIMFVLAYQIILFVIDPDKGLKQSRQLIVNLVKSIILVVLLPLIFHYGALFQRHFLVDDNVVWRVVLGTTSESSNIREAGYAVPSMIFISFYHPTGTSYENFYDNEGKLKNYSEACVDGEGNKLDAKVSDDSINQVKEVIKIGGKIGIRFALTSNLGAGGVLYSIGMGIHDIYTAIKEKLDEPTVCGIYYATLYAAGQSDKKIPTTQSAIEAIDDNSKSKVNYSNIAVALASNTILSSEIDPQATMEYAWMVTTIGAFVIIWFLLGYTLDIAQRAFKLAFLQMIAPVPVLLGVIPKNEKIYTDWKNSIIKTYLDIFVRTFVFGFIILMISLIPSFKTALFENFKLSGSPGALVTGLTFLALVIGLLRFGKEIPDMLKDFMKNSPGLLSGIELNPKSSFKKTGDVLSKPIGAIAGGIAGGISARNAVKHEGGGNFEKALATARGIKSGGKTGAKEGFGLTGLTASMNKANADALNMKRERDQRFADLYKGEYMHVIDGLSQNKVGRFLRAGRGDDPDGFVNSYLVQAGADYQSVATGITQIYQEAKKAAEAKVGTVADIMQHHDEKDGQFHIKFRGQDYFDPTYEGLEQQVADSRKAFIDGACENAITSYISKNGEDAIKAIQASYKNVNDQYFDTIGQRLQNILTNGSAKGVKDEENNALMKMLKEVNHGQSVNKNDFRGILDLMGSREFIDKYKSLQEDDPFKKDLDKALGQYILPVNKATIDVHNSIEMTQKASTGADMNFITGQANQGIKTNSNKKPQ